MATLRIEQAFKTKTKKLGREFFVWKDLRPSSLLNLVWSPSSSCKILFCEARSFFLKKQKIKLKKVTVTVFKI